MIPRALKLSVFILFLFAPATSFGDEHQPKYGALDFYPFGYREEGRIKGVLVDIMTRIEVVSGVRTTKVLEPIPRIHASIVRGDIDLVISAATLPGFRKMTSLGVVGCSRIIVASNKMAGISQIGDLESKKIGFVAHGFLYRKFNKNFGIIPVLTSTSESLFKMLVGHRVDGIFISDIVLNAHTLMGLPYSNVPLDWRKTLGSNVTIETLPTHLRMSKMSRFRHLEQKLREAVNTGNANGAFKKVYRSYGNTAGGRC